MFDDHASHISAIRSFGRTYTNKLGILDERPYDSVLNLVESRIVFELAHHKKLRAKDLLQVLLINKGYLSRTLSSLRTRNIIKQDSTGCDAREKWITLSAHGQRLFNKINKASQQRLESILNALGATQAADLARQLRVAETLLDPSQNRHLSKVKLRTLNPGDLGWLISRHGEIYFAEYGWNNEFEILVGKIAIAFAENHEPSRERAWIAESCGVRLGCIFLVRDNDQVAKLRILLVEPFARGLGVGTLLVRECIKFAQRSGYSKLTLWTNDVLTSARKIYEAEGFVLEKEEPHYSFGKKLVGQYWQKTL